MAASAGESPVQKQLRIKTGVVTRIEKELTRYHEELAAQRNKIHKMEEVGEDEHDVRKQKEVLEETETMIPDTMRRLNKSVEDLQEYLSAHGSEASVAGTPGLAAAVELLARHGVGSTGEAGAEEESI